MATPQQVAGPGLHVTDIGLEVTDGGASVVQIGCLSPAVAATDYAAAVLPVYGLSGVAARVKAGTPTDADWTLPPPLGTIVVDTSGLKIWVRTGVNVWRYATLT